MAGTTQCPGRITISHGMWMRLSVKDVGTTEYKDLFYLVLKEKSSAIPQGRACSVWIDHLHAVPADASYS